MTENKPSPKPAGSSAENGHGNGSNGAPWSPVFWANDKHVALQFESEDELDRAIDWLWTSPELKSMPRVHVGRNTMVVPATAQDLFARRGFQFSPGNVLSMGDLSAEEANRIRYRR